VLLRGPTSINASGRGQDPLYIVDGVIINGNLSDLNPSDIENVEVVKGAASALYGSNALGGVVNLVTSPIDETGSPGATWIVRNRLRRTCPRGIPFFLWTCLRWV